MIDSIDEANAGRPSGLTNRFILALLASLAALASLATNIILPAFSDIGHSLSVPTKDLAITLSGFFVPFALGQLLVGPASDRLGRKWLVLGGLTVLVAGSAICATANDLEGLVLGRVVQGLGACATSVLSRSIARDLFNGVALSRALSFIMVAMAAAPGFSPLLGGLLADLAGWRSAFWLVATLALALGVIYFAHMGETHPPAARQRATASEIFGDYIRLLKDSRFVLPAVSVSMVAGGLFTFFATTPAILMDGLGLTPIELGYFFATTVFVVFGAGIATPKLASRWGTHATAITGSIIALVGGLLLLSGSANLLHFSVSLSIFLLGMGLVNPLGTAMALQPFGKQAGAASALLGFLQMGTAIVAISVATSLDRPASLSLGCVLAVCMSLASASLLLLYKRQSAALAAVS
ncbi:multidrug effflux MFS transporter [Steroidobacter cummioxidans]|uniref:multidrug effflux MFS transporter n=1 Tax=Steroidobacter cummioxidans TaxID=1803913 RepID=UPI000E31C0A2|nr:multidrug effflux MFS transporter [Steroidobacter cummioxidans]